MYGKLLISLYSEKTPAFIKPVSFAVVSEPSHIDNPVVIYRALITPQPILSPESPDGCVLKSSLFS